jgi:2-amino-4-hydroxy-6-hydroxymethyldihydropteridine diphosphokinase
MAELAYLSLGANIGDRGKNLREAISRLQTTEKVVVISSFYETEPVDVARQSWFLNCVVSVETNRSPQQLMELLLHIEQEMGRRRLEAKGPRSIDIDILLFGDAVINSPELTVPHPAIQRRRFVLEPLAEIASNARHPVLKKTVRELLAELPEGQIVRKLAGHG